MQNVTTRGFPTGKVTSGTKTRGGGEPQGDDWANAKARRQGGSRLTVACLTLRTGRLQTGPLDARQDLRIPETPSSGHFWHPLGTLKPQRGSLSSGASCRVQVPPAPKSNAGRNPTVGSHISPGRQMLATRPRGRSGHALEAPTLHQHHGHGDTGACHCQPFSFVEFRNFLPASSPSAQRPSGRLRLRAV